MSARVHALPCPSPGGPPVPALPSGSPCAAGRQPAPRPHARSGSARPRRPHAGNRRGRTAVLAHGVALRVAPRVGQLRPSPRPPAAAGRVHQQRLFLGHPHTGLRRLAEPAGAGRRPGLQRLPPAGPLLHVQRLPLPRHVARQEPPRGRLPQPPGRPALVPPARLPRPPRPPGRHVQLHGKRRHAGPPGRPRLHALPVRPRQLPGPALRPVAEVRRTRTRLRPAGLQPHVGVPSRRKGQAATQPLPRARPHAVAAGRLRQLQPHGLAQLHGRPELGTPRATRHRPTASHVQPLRVHARHGPQRPGLCMGNRHPAGRICRTGRMDGRTHDMERRSRIPLLSRPPDGLPHRRLLLAVVHPCTA